MNLLNLAGINETTSLKYEDKEARNERDIHLSPSHKFPSSFQTHNLTHTITHSWSASGAVTAVGLVLQYDVDLRLV